MRHLAPISHVNHRSRNTLVIPLILCYTVTSLGINLGINLAGVAVRSPGGAPGARPP